MDPLKIVSTVRISVKSPYLTIPYEFAQALNLTRGDIVEFHIAKIHRTLSDTPEEKRIKERKL